MNIKDINIKVKCDMPNCKNNAVIKIEKEGFFRSSGVFICKDCMNDIYKVIGKRVTPKSPDNMLNKKSK